MGQIFNGHTDVVACDTGFDGMGIQTQYVLNGVRRVIRDTNGSQPGWGVAQTAGTVTSFRVCGTESSVIVRCTFWENA